MNFIKGGVCAPQGFQAAGIHVGVKTHADWKKDVALIVSDVKCTAAAVFTKNAVKAAPIWWTGCILAMDRHGLSLPTVVTPMLAPRRERKTHGGCVQPPPLPLAVRQRKCVGVFHGCHWSNDSYRCH